MRARTQPYLVGSLCLLLGGGVGLAADPPADDPEVWGPIQYDHIQGTAMPNGGTVSIVFDNFIVDNQGPGELLERKTLGMGLPVKLESGTTVTEIKADFRGGFLESGNVNGALVVLIGSEQEIVRFPNEEITDDGGDFILSMAVTERFANGSIIPVTLLLFTQRASAEDAVMLTIDTLDISAATE
jgi:hypothetical protein